MPAPSAADIGVAVFAKAPIAGFAKTRLIPRLGAAGAAALQARLVERAVETAVAARLGPVTLWGAPDARHPFFRVFADRIGVARRDQAEGDLGARMHAAFLAEAPRPLLLIGSDCPALTPAHLAEAAGALGNGSDAVFVPAEDGGYVLVGLRRPAPSLFSGIAWSTPAVMAATRARVVGTGLRATELAPLWDVDEPADLDRALAAGLLPDDLAPGAPPPP